MIVGVMHLELSIESAMSLKDKRAVLRSIKDRVQNKFNVSIAEVGDNDVWNYACLGVAMVSNDQVFANQVLNKVLSHIESLHIADVAEVEMEFIRTE